MAEECDGMELSEGQLQELRAREQIFSWYNNLTKAEPEEQQSPETEYNGYHEE